MRRALYYIPFIAILVITVIRVYTYFSANTEYSCRRKKSEISQNKIIKDFRSQVTEKVEKHLPSPHAELVLGMVVGIDNFHKIPEFQEALRTTSTIHVVVVSGFNINLVFSFIFRVLGGVYKKSNLVIGVTAAFLYSVMSGFEPPVIRAWIMGSILVLGKHHGRSLETFSVLVFSACMMMIWDPCYYVSLSFRLSFLATLGLILFSENIKNIIIRVFRSKSMWVEDLSATLSAQIMVTPMIVQISNQISLYGVLVNTLVLWTVPLTTILGFLGIFCSYISEGVSNVVFGISFVLTDIFVLLIHFFSKLPHNVIAFEISDLGVLIYFVITFLFWLFVRKLKICQSTS